MKKYSAIIILFTSFIFSSCLKDKDYDKGLIQSVRTNGDQKVIAIQLTAGDATNFLHLSFDASNTDTVVNFVPVVLGSNSPAPADIKVTLVQNNTLVTDYNSANGTAYQIPNAGMLVYPNGLVVTIPKGSNIGYLQVKFKPSNFIGTDWALGYSISSIDQPGYLISGNLQNGIVAMGIKNKYDGHYLLTGTMVDAANSALTGPYPIEVDLETFSGNSVILNPTQGPFAGSYLHPILSSGSPSAYGSFTPVFIFDANDNITSVVNAYGQPAGNGRSAQIDPSGVNKWFPTDRHIDVKYWMNQPSVITPHRTSFDEHFTYLRPR